MSRRCYKVEFFGGAKGSFSKSFFTYKDVLDACIKYINEPIKSSFFSFATCEIWRIKKDGSKIFLMAIY